ncbi:MAG TPA: AAA family ATPase [Mucilaginibacter sp.]|nr:AAA family ATPase [Mucilaginibacter sp.]
MPLSRDLKIDIFYAVKNQPNVFGTNPGPEALIDFIQEIWDLRKMSSEDPRYETAEQDFFQHTVRNYDWETDDIFLSRLRLGDETDEVFAKFIENILNPKYKSHTDEIIKFVLLIDPYLEKGGLKLAIQDYSNGIPIYKIFPKEEVDLLPANTKQNDIPFFLSEYSGRRADYATAHQKPQIYPAFIIVYNDGWNDYSIKTTHYLFYYDRNKEVTFIGEVKISKNDTELITQIPESFISLDDDFCSLGQSISYYQKLNQLFGTNLESVLFALKDVAFFPKILEKFDQFDKFKNSLIRGDRVERLLREARFRIYDFDLTKLYQFKYSFHPAYAEDPVNVSFDFDNTEEIPIRIIALIGKNGTGKTQLLTSLPLNISRKKDEYFTPKTPKFSKVIAVSYSIFDRFEIPKSSAEFNYVYCGLRNESGLLISNEDLELRFLNTWTSIVTKGRLQRWQQILSNFLEIELIRELKVITYKDEKGEEKWRVNIEGFNGIKKTLSSGQSILLYIISELTANVRLDSLILYDEPETHLHPNAISQLINSIYSLVEEFQSYCIIATHSPLVIRELPSRSVFVVERFENIPSIRRIGMESFGGNLSVLTEDVFGNREIVKKHELIIEKLVKQKFSYEEIMQLLQFDEIPVNLNIRLHAKSLINRENEKS